MPDLSAQQWTYLVVVLLAFGVLVTERLRTDVVGILVVLPLDAIGVLSPAEALAGFGSEPAIVLASIFVLGGYAPGRYRFADFVRAGTPLACRLSVSQGLDVPRAPGIRWPA